MANHPSSLKRQRQSEKRRVKNRAVKSTIKTTTKKVRATTTKSAGLAELTTAISKLAKAASKGVIHKNTASRKISRLAQFVNRLQG